MYTWTEQRVIGYSLISTVVDGKVTTFTNRHRPGGNPPPPPEPPAPPMPGIGQVIINHVGDCYD